MTRAAAISIAVAAAAAVCSPIAVPAAAQQPAPAPLTAADTDRIVPARVGQILSVRLQQSAGTGSSWRMVPAAGLIQIGPPIVLPAGGDGPPLVGGPQSHVFRVRVTTAGRLTLTFVDARSFGGPDQRGETATFILDAR